MGRLPLNSALIQACTPYESDFLFRGRQWRSEGGGGGRRAWPRAQALILEGAPAQLVGANFKKKIRPRPFFFFFCLSIFPPGADAGIYQTGGGRRSKHWPPGAGDPRYATGGRGQTYC